MTDPNMTGTHAQATRLLRWYPPAWRARYGDEFAELLAAELAEQPHNPRRTANIVASGLRARLADAGLTSHPLDQASAARAGLATLACCGALFAMFGAALWSQLATGLQWAVPDNRGITQAWDLMSLALLTFGVAAAAGLVALIHAAIVTVRRRQGRQLLGPSAVAVICAAVLFFGGRHFANAWPGTGGYGQGSVHAGVAAFGWALSMWITSYWEHPAMLAAFPATQIAWMALTPLAAGGLMISVARLIRRLDRSPRALSFEIWLGRLAGGGMLLFLGGVVLWLSSAAGPQIWLAGLLPVLPAWVFHIGSIDVVGLAVLVLVIATGLRAAQLAGRARATLVGR